MTRQLGIEPVERVLYCIRLQRMECREWKADHGYSKANPSKISKNLRFEMKFVGVVDVHPQVSGNDD